MSYERTVKAESDLAAEVKIWLDQAGEVDATEDAEHGLDRRGDETPGWMADKQQRLGPGRCKGSGTPRAGHQGGRHRV